MFDSWKKLFIGDAKERDKVLAPVEGKVVPLSEVNDPAFRQEILGKGVAIIPERGRIVAPFDGVVSVMFETKHAVSVTSEHGTEVIIHVGLDTVRLKGSYYTSFKNQGDHVKQGDLLLEFDRKAIKEAGYDLITPVIVCNPSCYPHMVCHSGIQVKELEPIIDL